MREDLPATYRAAGVVLNDHWDEMRREGLLSNRLFDLAGCGARVVSDDVRGLRDVFGDAFDLQHAAELGAAVATHLSESPERRELRKSCRIGCAATIASMRGRNGWWR